MFITKDDLYTHLRAENAGLITRGDDALITAAIDGAIAEAAGYLGDYDTSAIFAANSNDRHALLLIFTKDIAVWHLINLCSNGTLYEVREKRYNRAVEWLKGVQKGVITPMLPKKITETGEPASLIHTTSNPKREQHF